MLTIFSLPKPFVGEAAPLQETALRSWRLLGDDAQVVLVGDEAGVQEAAAKAGAEYVADVARSASGTPRLDDAFAHVDAIARHRLRLFVNADVVLLPDVLAAVEAVDGDIPFLLVGQTRELPVEQRALDDPAELRVRALREGTPRGPTALDWFAFPAGAFEPLPPFLVGRAGFDNWLVWRARQAGRVVDATHDVVAIHQPHGYAHLAGGKREAYYGREAQGNIRAGGGRGHIYTLHDASHRLVNGTLRRNYGSILRTRETARKIAWKLGCR